jgi:peptide/nickel transport system permease protein
MALTLAGLTVLVFLMLRLIPGTVVEQMIGADAVASPAMVAQLKAFFGLDPAWYLQYGRWIGRLVQGDLGISWRTGKPVVGLILERLPVTLELTALAWSSRSCWGCRRGVLSAVRRNGALDNITRVGTLLGLSVPVFWQAPCSSSSSRSISAGCRRWCGWISSPIPGAISPSWSCPRSASAPRRRPISPAPRGLHARRAPLRVHPHRLRQGPGPRRGDPQARASQRAYPGRDGGRAADGHPPRRHRGRRGGLHPARRGRLVLWSIYQRDYPLTQSTILFIAFMFMSLNLMVDLVYGYLDPRIRYRR